MEILTTRTYLIPLLVVFVMAFSGCSINHPVAKDYQAYINNDKYPRTLPESKVKSSYAIAEKTQNHSYEFRAASVGYAHVWIVEFGKILDTTLNAEYVQEAFDSSSKISNKADSNQLTFELVEYTFENYQAYVTMDITLSKDEEKLFSERYTAVGVNQAGKMWSAGPFAMKNATLQSTKFAIDDILRDLINDLNKL